MKLTALLTPTGPAYLNVNAIEAISAPFTQSAREVRQVTTSGGAKIFVLSVPKNYEKLAFLLPDEAAELAQAAPLPRRRPVPVVATAPSTEAPTADEPDTDESKKSGLPIKTRKRHSFRKGNR